MSKIRIELNSAGIRSLLKSNEVQTMLSSHAKGIVGRCGSGYKQDMYVGKKRANAMVWADTFEAKRDNSKNNTILKAVK